MKTLPAIIATGIAIALVLSPLVATAAGTVTFTTPTTGQQFTSGQTLSISGTVTPAPGQTDEVLLTITPPSGGSAVWAGYAVVDPTTGTFTASTVLGGTSYSATGAYLLKATDSYSATGSVYFQYTSTGPSSFNSTQALITIENEIKVLSSDLKGNVTALSTALSSEQSTNSASFKNIMTDLSGNFTAISASLTTLTTNLATVQSTLQTDVTNIQGQLTTISNNITTLQGAVTAADTAATNAETAATNANNAVSSTQTYVLVVAVLAAITLVLELAILVRKVS